MTQNLETDAKAAFEILGKIFAFVMDLTFYFPFWSGIRCRDLSFDVPFDFGVLTSVKFSVTVTVLFLR